MLKSFICIALFCFITIWLNGQRVLEGLVHDKQGLPIEFVIVVQMNIRDSTIVAYNMTDEDGHFKLNLIEIDSFLLSCSKISYTPYYQTIIVNTVEKLPPVTILLEEDVYELEEIVVNEKAPPIILKGDTTQYKVSNYIDGTEVNIEDVLKKIPGIQVKENGKLTYQGKDLSKVMIEGDDIFGANYTIGTRNLAGKIIDNVQVIDKYLDNPLLKGVVESDAIVLNLNLGEDFKNILTGNTNTGTGTGFGEDAKYYLGVTLFSIQSNSKTIGIANYNNVRFDAIGEITFYSEGMTRNNQPNLFYQEAVSPILRNNTSLEIDLPESFLLRGDIGVGNINHLKRFKNGLKLAISAFTATNAANSLKRQYEQYFSFTDTLTYFDETSQRSKNFQNKITINTDYVSLKSGYSVYAQTVGTMNNNRIIKNINRNLVENLYASTLYAPEGLQHSIEISKKVRNKSIVQLIANSYYNSINEKGIYNNPIFKKEDDQVIQQIKRENSQIGVGLRFVQNGKIASSSTLAFYRNGANLATSNATEFMNLMIKCCDEANSNKRTDKVVILDNKVGYQVKSVRLSLTSKIMNNDVSFSNSLNAKRGNYFLYDNNFYINLDLPRQFTYTTKIDTKQKLSAISTTGIYAYLIDFQNIYKGYDDVFKSTMLQVEQTWKRKNDIKGYYILFTANYRKTNNEIGYRTNFREGFFLEDFFLPNESDQFSILGGGSYNIHLLKSRVYASIGTGILNNNNIINNQFRAYKTNYINYRIEYGTAFQKINFFITYENQGSQTQNKSENFAATLKYNLNTLSVKGVFKLNSAFYFDFIWNRFATKSFITNDYSAIACNFHLHPNSKKWLNHNFELQINNPQNLRAYNWNYISDFFFQQTEVVAVPRFVLLNWFYTF